ncbi:MAG: S24/S26 family peptidase [Acidobacteria bacterium]|nr:S24/S26 family peptidase [Acidobacteriota bacterium]
MKCQLAAEVLRAFGEVRLQVKGSSMLPSMWPGDILRIRSIHPQDGAWARPGDIVVFHREGRLITHRVVETSSHPGAAYWITRGDRHTKADPPVSPDELLGRVVAIQRGESQIDPRATRRWPYRIARLVLRHSDRCTKLLFRLRALRRACGRGLASDSGTTPYGRGSVSAGYRVLSRDQRERLRSYL